jgi:hypothetical protein
MLSKIQRLKISDHTSSVRLRHNNCSNNTGGINPAANSTKLISYYQFIFDLALAIMERKSGRTTLHIETAMQAAQCVGHGS